MTRIIIENGNETLEVSKEQALVLFDLGCDTSDRETEDRKEVFEAAWENISKGFWGEKWG